MNRAASFLKIVCSTLLGVAALYATTLAVAGTLFAVIEAKQIGESIYWAATTATSTGYGDVLPTTAFGRGIAVFLMHFGPGFAFPLMTALMSAKLIVDHDAFTHHEQEEIKALLTDIRNRMEADND